ncbi:jacalin-related lectin 19-like [Zingiber officinale]|uniref:jacalin-related lectin 19-like n=1 Tax=Zingiber officinale TaxID=94328 RepID=UPI001C4AA742|nr:jacalin-related lectin 19-like [Zingiber officinale]
MAEPSLTPDVEVNECFTELYKSSEQNITLKVGPWGGNGQNFDIISDSQLITKVVVKSGDVVDYLEIFYSVGGNSVTSYSAGGSGGDSTNKIPLDEGEYINWISGSVINDYNSQTCITQLGFKTNRGNEYGPFGNKEGSDGTGFTIPFVDGRIVGFFGVSGKYINAIGVYAAPN